MANIAASLTVLLSITGGPFPINEQTPPLLVQMTNSPGQRIQQTLVSGPNTITPPQSPQPTATFAVIIPPASSSVTKVFKGVSGDTGYTLSNTQPSVIPIGSVAGPGGGIGSFILNASGTEAVWIYFI